MANHAFEILPCLTIRADPIFTRLVDLFILFIKRFLRLSSSKNNVLIRACLSVHQSITRWLATEIVYGYITEEQYYKKYYKNTIIQKILLFYNMRFLPRFELAPLPRPWCYVHNGKVYQHIGAEINAVEATAEFGDEKTALALKKSEETPT